MQPYLAELHVHTVLSPCAQVEMIPPLIVQEALQRQITLLAITDHNSSANIAAVQAAAAETQLTVLPGMELQTQEEVHLLCLFDTLDQMDAWQTQVDRHLPAIPNNPDFFGEQFVVDETGEFIRREQRLLSNSVEISLEDAVKGIRALGGLAIPAHVNRRMYGLLASLGFVPPDIHFEALEISRHLSYDQAVQQFPQLAGYPLIQSGDVHQLDDFLGVTEFHIEHPCISELRLALLNQAGRCFHVLQKMNKVDKAL